MSHISVFQMFKIGIGPSSSHTVGPMKAARSFLLKAKESHNLDPSKISSIKTNLFGSLALTGQGHGTDKAILLGLMGESPDKVIVKSIPEKLEKMRATRKLSLLGEFEIPFNENEHLIYNKTKRLPFHTNGIQFTLESGQGQALYKETYYSVGGGFVVTEEETKQAKVDSQNANTKPIPFPFSTSSELLSHCQRTGMKIAEIMMENEKVYFEEQEIRTNLMEIWNVMKECINNGISSIGDLPGPLKLKRRAHVINEKLEKENGINCLLNYMDWVNMWALAVCEENAAGGRVVTAPTNGAAGIIPAVLQYYDKFHSKKFPNRHIDFLMTSSAIGTLFKLGATISGAEGGCQGEVGTACSMAAAGLTAALGGSNSQIENAAEIGMEHNLGLTCDPVGGLVQIPCIERNTMGAIKAINAASLALTGDGNHTVSLDSVIKVMKMTGDDMRTKYKETAKGGLAAELAKIVEREKKGIKPDSVKRRGSKKMITNLGDILC